MKSMHVAPRHSSILPASVMTMENCNNSIMLIIFTIMISLQMKNHDEEPANRAQTMFVGKGHQRDPAV
jgi:hypothetical protein